MKKLKVGLMVFCIFFALASCKQKKPKSETKSSDEIIKADKAFSALSKKEGMKMAFIDYIDNEGVLLRPGHMPIIGANAIDYLSQVNDTSYVLTWTPSGAGIAGSGDLGYTYGIYSLAMKDTILRGTYVSIWKKQGNGEWKFVLDCGNQGIGDPAN